MVTGIVAAAVVAPPKLVSFLTTATPAAPVAALTGVTREELLKTGYLGDLWSSSIHVSSLRQPIDYVSVGRKALAVEELPQGALVTYERPQLPGGRSRWFNRLWDAS